MVAIVDAKEIAQARAEGKRAAFQPLSQYVDYRTYLDYDMYVKNLSNGYDAPLSEVSGDGSGGENQAILSVNLRQSSGLSISP